MMRFLAVLLLSIGLFSRVGSAPIPIIFDTDMGNDIDDALALAMVCRAANLGEVDFLMAGSSNPNQWAAPAMRAILDYYGLPGVEVAICSEKVGRAQDRFTSHIAQEAGLEPDPAAEDAVSMMRRLLYAQENQSVRIVTVGFSTNMANLLRTEANHNDDGIALSGSELVRSRVDFLVMMAGHFTDPNFREYNVVHNVPAFRHVMEEWPGTIYLSGYEIGHDVYSRHEDLERQLEPENPVYSAYLKFYERRERPGDRHSWDQTAVLFAIEPEKGYFDLRGPVRVEVSERGQTTAQEAPELEFPRHHFRFNDEYPPARLERILADWYHEPDVAAP